jgi:hypothetical protein
MTGQANLDVSGATAAIITQMQNAFALNIGKLVGSHTTVAKQLDELATIDGLKALCASSMTLSPAPRTSAAT